jgi:hypothetical protein
MMPLDEKRILPQMGAALIPTVVGLALRQLLFAYDIAQREQDAFYRSLEEELRQSATEFKKAQQRLVAVITEFVDTRTTLFGQEEIASQKYVAALGKATGIFVETADAYPTAIAKALTQLNQRLTGALAKLQSFIDIAQSLDATALADASEHLRSLSASAGGLVAQMSKLTTSVGLADKSIEALPGQLDSTLKVSVKKFSESAAGMTKVTEETLQALKTTFTDAHAELGTTMAGLKDDLNAIDDIVREFIELLDKRVRSLAANA